MRKFKGTKTITEVNDAGNPKDSVFVMGDHASLVSIPTAGFNFYNFPGIEKAERLDIVDSRLKTAEGWIAYYERERTRRAGFRVRRYLREAATISDADMEWEM